MPNDENTKSNVARNKAEQKFAELQRRDDRIMEYQRQVRDAETAKLYRLRAMRLAREATEPKATASPAPNRRRRSKRLK